MCYLDDHVLPQLGYHLYFNIQRTEKYSITMCYLDDHVLPQQDEELFAGNPAHHEGFWKRWHCLTFTFTFKTIIFQSQGFACPQVWQVLFWDQGTVPPKCVQHSGQPSRPGWRGSCKVLQTRIRGRPVRFCSALLWSRTWSRGCSAPFCSPNGRGKCRVDFSPALTLLRPCLHPLLQTISTGLGGARKKCWCRKVRNFALISNM